jgi:hypothetical protein
MELIVLLAAESDIQTAYNHFEDFKEGFGLKFIQDLELAYEYLRHHPRIGRLYKSNRRRFLLSRYPFWDLLRDRGRPNCDFGRFRSPAGSGHDP